MNKKIDVNLLRYHMNKKGYTQEKLAKKMNINKTTLTKKINGTSDFYRNEINKIIDILDLTKDESIKIFFADFVA